MTFAREPDHIDKERDIGREKEAGYDTVEKGLSFSIETDAAEPQNHRLGRPRDKN